MPMKRKNTKKTAAKKTPVAKPLKNKVILLLDSSGSMNCIAAPTVAAFNRILESIKAASFATGQETDVTLWTFGEQSAVKCKFSDVPIADVKKLDDIVYKPDGETPLYDCIGDAITEAAMSFPDANTAFVLSVITDGQNNYSKRYDASKIRQLIAKVQGTDRWTVTFTVPPAFRRSVLDTLGLHEGNVADWAPSAAGAAQVADSFSGGYNRYFALRSSGETKTAGFFVTNMSKVKTSAVKKQLTDVAKNYAVLHVRAEAAIKPFVEGNGYDYVLGNAFYQLSKPEEIQLYKDILLREKGKKAIYGGAEARELLGFPDALTVKVKPGNHANWDVFIQSTSVNRMLVRGTDVLYRR